MKKFVDNAGFAIYLVLSLALIRLIYVGLKYAMFYFGLYARNVTKVLYWVGGTLLGLILGTVIFGVLAMIINKINPFPSRKSNVYILGPAILLLSLYQCYELYRFPYLYAERWSYVPYACAFILLLSFTVKTYKMLSYDEFSH